MVISEFRAATSALLDRWRWGQQHGFTFGGRRDTYAVFGYPQQITARDYREKYARNGIAKAVVEAFPKACWRGGVEVYETEDPNDNTEFEKAFKALEARLHIWNTLQNADILAGLSTYSVIFIGAPGDPATELPKGNPDQLLYLSPFFGGGGPQGNRLISRGTWFDVDASIQTFETNTQSPRFGEPLTYTLKRTDLNAPMLQRPIHYSRIIHICEGALDNVVYGAPTLESIYNLLLDLEKISGAGSESYFLRANQGLVLDIDKDMGLAKAPGQPVTQGLSPDDVKNLRDKAEELQHQLQRVMVTRGVTTTQLGSDVANFGPSVDSILKLIAGSKGIPARILTGSEMGTLASEQDSANFDSRVQDRRTGYCGPMIVRKLVDRLIDYGYLPTPKQYDVGWPVEEEMTEGEKAKYALDLANVNKTQGEIVIKNDEIREKAFKLKPLTDAEKTPVAAPVRETGVALNTDNPDDPNALPNTPQMKAALRALEQAIEDDDADAVARIVGLGGPGSGPQGGRRTSPASDLKRRTEAASLASHDAKLATDHADAHDTVAAHQAAFNAHDKAMNANREVPGHEELTKFHDQKATQHIDRIAVRTSTV